MAFPHSGKASVYDEGLAHRATASGQRYDPRAFAAAILQQSHWYDLPLGTRLRLTSGHRSVMLEINDRGAGRPITDPSRILDLSNAAMAALKGVDVHAITNRTAGLIEIDSIEIVSRDAKLGPAP